MPIMHKTDHNIEDFRRMRRGREPMSRGRAALFRTILSADRICQPSSPVRLVRPAHTLRGRRVARGLDSEALLLIKTPGRSHTPEDITDG